MTPRSRPLRERVGTENTIFIKGYFPTTAAQLPPDGTYCMVHIDTDLFAPIMAGLEYFYPRIVPGGFLIIHDYGSLAWAGAEKAVDAFFADKPEAIVPIPDSAGSAVIRKQRRPTEGLNWLATRQILNLGAWYESGNGDLAYVLTEGWSSPEGWGVWGVGDQHRIEISSDAQVSSLLWLDLEVEAFVPASANERSFDIVVYGNPVATWSFSASENRRMSSISFRNRLGQIGIAIRPHFVISPRDSDLSASDDRPLGLALRRIRLRQP